MRVMPVGVDRMLVVLRKRDGDMHGDGDKIFSKTFENPVGCHLCPREMMRWVTT